MKCLILKDNGIYAEKKHNIKELKKQLEERNINYDILTGRRIFHKDLTNYDFIITKCGAIGFNFMEELTAVKDKVFNKPEAIILARDKWFGYEKMLSKVRQPKTSLKQEDIGFPCIVKYRTGSFGKRVDLVNNKEELDTLIKEKYNANKQHLLYQEFIPNDRTSIRIIMIGGEYIGACKFTAKEENIQSNLGSGGSAEVYEPTQEMINMAKIVNNEMGLDYCGIDLIINNITGRPVFIEANSNAWTSGFDKITKINTTKLFLDYVINQVENK